MTIVMLSGTMQLSQIVEQQAGAWFIFKGGVPAFIAFVIYLIAGHAETNRASRELDLESFNAGDYVSAVESKVQSETISKVLYPSDDIAEGQLLRLRQQYFFVAATLQDVMRRYRKTNVHFEDFPNQVAIQLNDTHPAIAIPELMRLLLDVEGQSWELAWDVCVKTFAYTNHTLMPEALETWSVDMFGSLLPRHLEIIYEINRRFLLEVAERYPGNLGLLAIAGKSCGI